MKLQYSDSQVQLMAEAGISWRLITTAAVLAAKKVKIYSTLRITAIADSKITLDGLDSVIILAGDTVIISAGLGNGDGSKYVEVTSSTAVNMSVAIDASRERQQESVE